MSTDDEEQTYVKQIKKHLKDSVRHLDYALDMVQKALQGENNIKKLAFLDYIKDALTEYQLNMLATQITIEEAQQELQI